MTIVPAIPTGSPRSELPHPRPCDRSSNRSGEHSATEPDLGPAVGIQRILTDGDGSIPHSADPLPTGRSCEPSPILDHLTPHQIALVEATDMAFVVTVTADGECDCALRSGRPGFVRVLNPTTLAYPQPVHPQRRPGDVRIDMLRDGGTGLHVDGTASLVTDAMLRGEHPDLPLGVPAWVLVDVVRAYPHRAHRREDPSA